MLENAVTVTSLNRDVARSMQVFEFESSMPDDNLDVAEGTRLHPATCELTTDFVSVTAAASP